MLPNIAQGYAEERYKLMAPIHQILLELEDFHMLMKYSSKAPKNVPQLITCDPNKIKHWLGKKLNLGHPPNRS